LEDLVCRSDTPFCVLCHGDDAVLGFRSRMVAGLVLASPSFLRSGFEDELILQELFGLEFCSKRLMPVVLRDGSNSMVFGPKLGRFLARTFYTLHPTKDWPGFLAQLVKSWAHVASYNPIVKAVLSHAPVGPVTKSASAAWGLHSKGRYEGHLADCVYDEFSFTTYMLQVYSVPPSLVRDFIDYLAILNGDWLAALDHPLIDLVLTVDGPAKAGIVAD